MPQRMRAPGSGDAVDVQVGFAARLHAAAAEFGQAFVDPPRNAAEIGVAGIAQAQHRVLELRQLGRAAPAQELDQANRIIRRIAIALGADHHSQ